MNNRLRFLTRCALLPTLFSLAFSSLAGSATETNLVQDGGFEQGGAGWAFSVNAANASGQVVADEAHSGKKSFRLSNNSGFAPNVFGRMTQMVLGLEPFTTYRISCFARGTNAGIVWIGGGPGWYLRAPFPKGTFGWTNISTEYTTGEDPPDFELMIATESQTAAVWVDDVRMEPVKADTARRDAVMKRLAAQRYGLQERLVELQARATENSAARFDAGTQLGLAVAGRYLKRTEIGAANTLQGGAWTHLQLEEIPMVLDATERRLHELSSAAQTAALNRPQPWPVNGPVQLRDGMFYAKMKHGAEQPFWFYGYGH